MNDLAGDSQSRRHSLSDWLALHKLDPVTCRRILEAARQETAGETAAQERLNSGDEAPDPGVLWLRIAEAMRDFFSEQQGIVDDTFEKTVKIAVDPRGNARKALTLDNGPTAYPTILFSYRREPSDCLVMAHEFGHALQIRASGGKFLPPIMREVCAFISESALLSHTLRCDAPQYADLSQVWHADNQKYFGAQKSRLQADLSGPDAPYRYSWNYPIARHLAIQISERCSRDWIWSVFEGEISVQDVLRKLMILPRDADR